MKQIFACLAICMVLALSACAPTNISELTKALATDQASVCVRITSVYGTAMANRTNIKNGSVSCTGDGMTVRSPSKPETDIP